VNLRPPSVSFGSLVFLWLAVSLSCRLGAPTWAEIAKLDNPQAWGIGGGLVTLFILGALLFIGLLMAYVNLARPVATPPRAVTPEPVRMATEVERVIYHPAGNDQEGWFLDASPEQWRAVYNLIQTRNNIPFNYIDGKGRAFPTKESLNTFRTQLVGAGLAYVDKSNTVTLNAAGRQMVTRYGSPTPPGNGKK
jgi:hypothetical protein